MKIKTFGFSGSVAVAGAILVLAGCGGAGDAKADSDSAGVSESARELLPADIKDRGYVSVATTFGFPPTQFKDEKNEPAGSTVDISDALGEKLGIEFRQVDAPFDAIIAGLEADRYDVTVGAMNITDERREVLNFVEYMDSATVLVVHSDNASELKTWEDVCGKDVGQVKGSVQIDEVEEASEEHCVSAGRDPINVVTFNGSDDVYQAVVTGRIDGSLRSYSSQVYAVENSDGELALAEDTFATKGSLGIATAADQVDLAKAIQAALQELMDEGTYVSILEEWGEDALAIETTELLEAGGTAE